LQVYLLGLRMWYLPALAYSVLNLVLFFVSGFVAIPGISKAALTGHLAFSPFLQAGLLGRSVDLLAGGRCVDAEAGPYLARRADPVAPLTRLV